MTVSAMRARLLDSWPFLGAALAAFAALPIARGESLGFAIEIAVAAGLVVAVAGSVALVDWSRLPRLAGALPLLAAFTVVGLLRDAGGGAASGYGPLVLLPVFWLAVRGTRREVVFSLVGVAAVFVVPILVDPDSYPSSEWRRALIWLIVTPVVGLTTNGLVERVRESARSDALTGLPNRRSWEERLPAALRLGERSGLPVSVVLLDLDGFKAYNDLRGHPAGDRLLTAATAAWLSQVRVVDFLARLGGDEFALLLPDAALDAAAAVAARLRSVTPEVGLSAGVVQWDGGESAAELVQRADAALYA
ncbi:MAG: diguanylate cyclase domain-containing protein, partial [Gaiellaceae bacterium]